MFFFLIKAEFTYDRKRVLKSFVFSGHDDSGPGGANVICAAASALALNFAQSLTKLLKLKLNGAIRKGLISLSVDGDAGDGRAEGIRLLTESVRLGFGSINEKYGEVIKIIDITED